MNFFPKYTIKYFLWRILFFIINSLVVYYVSVIGKAEKFDSDDLSLTVAQILGKVKYTAQDKLQFFGGTKFSSFHIAEQESLDKLSVYIGERFARESRGDIVFKQPLVFFLRDSQFAD